MVRLSAPRGSPRVDSRSDVPILALTFTICVLMKAERAQGMRYSFLSSSTQRADEQSSPSLQE
ncbi:MAG: hypothetical protein RL685_3627 [Pseudomonadota bacterium]|jgi:hypothetical protein